MFKTEDDVPAGKLKKRKESDPDPLVRGTDPRIRISTKTLRIPNTAK